MHKILTNPKFIAVFLIVALYLSIASIVYRLKHPDLTETELILDMWKIITWR